jgi:hypothetical protein
MNLLKKWNKNRNIKEHMAKYNTQKIETLLTSLEKIDNEVLDIS